MEIIAIICSAAALIATLVLIVIVLKGKNKSADGVSINDTIFSIQENLIKETNRIVSNESKNIKDSNNTIAVLSSEFIKTSKEDIQHMRLNSEASMNNLETRLKESIRELKQDVSSAIDKMNQSNTESMKNILESNEKKLEDMRRTVDEKLSSTLNDRITSAFKQVTDSLSTLQEKFGEMQELSKQVTGLNRTFSNVKTRGNWGEMSLEALLTQILSPEQFEKQYVIDAGKSEKQYVDFAIKMPGANNKEPLILPIDAKFPKEDFERLLDATEACNAEAVKEASVALQKAIKAQAKSISKKYIMPPKTTDFAIMYLPTEGLYAEVVKNPTLCDELQNQYKVIPCGPTVIGALLNSLQVGFTTLKIQKGSLEIVEILKSFKGEFIKLELLIEKIRKNAKNVVESIEEVDKRNKKITKCLSKVDEIAIDNNEPIKLGFEDITNGEQD